MGSCCFFQTGFYFKHSNSPCIIPGSKCKRHLSSFWRGTQIGVWLHHLNKMLSLQWRHQIFLLLPPLGKQNKIIVKHFCQTEVLCSSCLTWWHRMHELCKQWTGDGQAWAVLCTEHSSCALCWSSEMVVSSLIGNTIFLTQIWGV